MKPATKEDMLKRLDTLMSLDWYHYMADRLTNSEVEQWRAEKAEFTALREEYKATYGELPNTPLAFIDCDMGDSTFGDNQEKR